MQSERDGKHLGLSGLSVIDAVQWQPLYGYHSKWTSDRLGRIFAPMVIIDRQFFHHTHYIFDDDFFEWIKSISPTQVHPTHREEFAAQQTTDLQNQVQLRRKLETTIIPEVDFIDARIIDILEYLSLSYQEFDPQSLPSKNEYVNIIFNTRGLKEDEIPTVTFNAQNTSILEILEKTTDIAGLKYYIEQNWVLVGNRYYQPTINVTSEPSELVSRLKRIIIPELDFREAMLTDISKHLTACSVEYDKASESAKEIPMVLTPHSADAGSEITMHGYFLSIYDVLAILSQLTGVSFEIKTTGIEYRFEPSK